MPEWLKIYLAFALAGGVVSYWTVIRESIKEAKAIDEEIEIVWDTNKFIYFFTWVFGSIITAPIIFVIITTGNIEEWRATLIRRWLAQAGHSD